MNNIESIQTICILEDDILCVRGNDSKGFYLIKISTHQLIKNILGPNKIYAINECLDDLFLCSIIDEIGNNYLIKYKYEQLNLIKIYGKEKAHDKRINFCFELNDGTIASGRDIYLIK